MDAEIPADSRRRRSRAIVRIPIKIAIFAIVVLFVLFPSPAQLYRNVGHWRNLDALIDADNPDLRILLADFETARRTTTAPATDARGVQLEVQAFVYKKVPYEWDWVQWGAADYVPTVAEMFAAAKDRPTHELREDCDGRAVICASLLRALGYKSRILCDLEHMWVETPEAALMGPGMTPTVKSSPTGNQTNYLAAVRNAPTAWSFGVAVFPLGRELVIWATLILLSLTRGMNWKAALLGTVLTLQGLFFMRAGLIMKSNWAWLSQAWPGNLGAAHVVVGLAILWIAASRARRAAPSL